MDTAIQRAPTSIAVPGRSCWRRERAARATFLIDGAAYFAAFAAAAEKAERSIIILAWDFHGAVCLRADNQRKPTTRLDEFLNDLVKRRRSLNVYVLDWDYPLLYAIERQLLPAYRFHWWTHRRFHFRLDARHGAGGSHHQKIAVVDDSIAFVGGIDFAPGRWDTPHHRCDDPCRVSPSGEPCGPYHDLMMAVDGKAAATIGVLARERWYRATGKRLVATFAKRDCWPETLPVDLRDVDIAIARTFPPTEGHPAIREVEALYCDAIAAARRWIYIENQYLTAQIIGEALCQRLREAQGPEIVIVTTQVCAGWLEEGTMGVLRKRLVEKLRAADRFGRLRLLTPVVPGLTNTRYTVHAKAMIVDGTFARVGSANLNNRSMGLDSECDLAVEADGDPVIAAGISDFRDRLLAEHLCTDPARVAAAFAETDSLIATIDRLRSGDHSLVPLDATVPEWLDGLMPEADVVDPDRPLDPQGLVESIAPVSPDIAHRSRRWAVIPLAVALLAAAWTLVPRQWWDTETLAHWLAALNGSPLAPFVVTGVFVAGGLVFVPITALILAAGMAFGPVEGMIYSAFGACASGLAGHALGRVAGGDIVHRLYGSRLRQLRSRLARHGILAVAAVRVLPLGPFSLVNMAAGIAGVRVRDFLVGTLLGMIPGIITLTLFGDRLAQAARRPSLANVAIAAALALVLIAIGLWSGQRLARRDPAGEHVSSRIRRRLQRVRRVRGQSQNDRLAQIGK